MSMKEHTVHLKHLRMAPRKVRAVAGLIRKLPLQEAEVQLMTNPRRAAKPLLKLMRSAEAGAKERGFETGALYVESVRVDGGPMLKRFMARARGGASSIEKKTSHVTLVLVEKEKRTNRFTIVPPEKEKKEEKKKSTKRPSEKKKEDREPRHEESMKKKRGFFSRTFSRKLGDGK